jgi:ferredoxin
MTPELLWKLGRLGDPTLSAAGNHVAYTVRRYDLEENSGTSTIYIKDLQSGEQRELLSAWNSISDLQFANSPFGERLYFSGQSGKQEDEASQVWALNPIDGGVYQVTSLSTDDIQEAKDDGEGGDNTNNNDDNKDEGTEFGGVANLKVAPTGKHIAFTVDIKLDETVNDIYDVLSLDLTGSTRIYKSGLQKDRQLQIALDPEKWKGVGACVDVCPTNVFELDQERRLAATTRSERCVPCGACIVQCPCDALSFRSPTGEVMTPDVVRRFKLNMLGKRLVHRKS